MSLHSIQSVKHKGPTSQSTKTYLQLKEASELLTFSMSHPLAYMLVMLFPLKLLQNTKQTITKKKIWQDTNKKTYNTSS